MAERADGSTATKPRRKKIYQVIAHWQGLHDGQMKPWCDVGDDHVFEGGEGEEAKMALREAFADFHHAKEGAQALGWTILFSDGRESWHAGERVGYSVDLLEETLRWVENEKGGGRYVRDGERRVVESWSGAPDDPPPVTRVDHGQVRALAEGMHKQAAAILCSACGLPAVDLRYSPEGHPFCAGHLPGPQEP